MHKGFLASFIPSKSRRIEWGGTGIIRTQPDGCWEGCVWWHFPLSLPFLCCCIQRQTLQDSPKSINNAGSKAKLNFTVENSDFVRLLDREDASLQGTCAINTQTFEDSIIWKTWEYSVLLFRVLDIWRCSDTEQTWKILSCALEIASFRNVTTLWSLFRNYFYMYNCVFFFFLRCGLGILQWWFKEGIIFLAKKKESIGICHLLVLPNKVCEEERKTSSSKISQMHEDSFTEWPSLCMKMEEPSCPFV